MKKPLLLKLFAVTMLICVALATLVACGTIVNTKIKFILDDEVYETIELHGQSSIMLPKEPKKEDCVFEGWFLDKDKCLQPFLGDLPQNSQVVLEVYGKWSDTPCSHEWAILEATQPTCSSTGKEIRSCTICGKNSETVLEKLEHDFVNGVCINKGCKATEADYGSVGLDYLLNNDKMSYSVSGIGTCTNTDVVIPTSYNSLPVTSIGDEAFKGCDGLKSITIPEGITRIGDKAFYECDSLTSVTIPEGVPHICDKAFYNCYTLKKVTIPESVELIGEEAFYGCRGLTSITIPRSILYIGENAFSGCYNLVEVINKSELNITKDSSDYGYLATNALIVHNGKSKIVDKDGYLFITDNYTNYLLGYIGSDDSLVLPNDYNGQDYEIYKYAFYGYSDLTSVTIGNGVTSIATRAFYNCNSLTSITVGNGVTSISENVFEYCDSLTSVTYLGTIDDWVQIKFSGAYSNPLWYASDFYIDNKLVTEIKISTATSINVFAFCNYANLTKVIIGNNVTSVSNVSFYACSGIESITVLEGNTKYHSEGNCLINTESKTLLAGCKNSVIPDDGSVTSIAPGAFYYCLSLKSVNIPDCISNIGEQAFDSCIGLESITVSEGNTKYHSKGNCLIETKSKTLVIGCKNSVIPNDGSVTSIGSSAFYYCSELTGIIIPDSIISIGDYAFYGCRGLTSVTIGNSVTSIGYAAFSYCSRLTSLIIPDSVTDIGFYAFFNCSGLTSVTIGKNVTSVFTAFNLCNKVVEIINKSESEYINDEISYTEVCIIHNGESKIVNKNDYLFITYNNTNYLLGYVGNDTALVLPNNYNGQKYEIYHFAFYGNKNITSVIIPDSVTSIGVFAFYDCSGLTSVTIGNGVTSIGDSVFSGCSGLTSVIIGNSVTSIGYYAFDGCNSLTNITIPDSVTSIDKEAFAGCSGLTSVTIGSSVTSIYSKAFYNCRNLAEINFNGTVKEWKTIAKALNWNKGVPAEKVICTDGEVKL